VTPAPSKLAQDHDALRGHPLSARAQEGDEVVVVVGGGREIHETV
jgi:hypothetical protein